MTSSSFASEAKREDGWRPVTLAAALGTYRMVLKRCLN
jgi:hypothetical protein